MANELALGPVSLTLQVASAQACADFGYDNKCAGVVFTASSGNCDCLSTVTGYTDAAQTQESYLWLDPAPQSCLNTMVQEQIIHDMGEQLRSRVSIFSSFL